jgi:hypothetical protein
MDNSNNHPDETEQDTITKIVTENGFTIYLSGSASQIRVESANGRVFETNDTSGNMVMTDKNTNTSITFDKEGSVRIDCARNFAVKAKGNVTIESESTALHSFRNMSLFSKGSIDCKATSSILVGAVAGNVAIQGMDVNLKAVKAIHQNAGMEIRSSSKLRNILEGMAVECSGTTTFTAKSQIAAIDAPYFRVQDMDFPRAKSSVVNGNPEQLPKRSA